MKERLPSRRPARERSAAPVEGARCEVTSETGSGAVSAFHHSLIVEGLSAALVAVAVSAMLEFGTVIRPHPECLLCVCERVTEPLSVGMLADVATLSERQVVRSFPPETGETAARAIERLRVKAARICLENGREAVEVVSAAVGFSDTARKRRAFLRVYSQPPQALRRPWRARSNS